MPSPGIFGGTACKVTLRDCAYLESREGGSQSSTGGRGKQHRRSLLVPGTRKPLRQYPSKQHPPTSPNNIYGTATVVLYDVYKLWGYPGTYPAQQKQPGSVFSAASSQSVRIPYAGYPSVYVYPMPGIPQRIPMTLAGYPSVNVYHMPDTPEYDYTLCRVP